MPDLTAYRIEVYWSAEDAAWIADVPELTYCSAHGSNPHEALAEVEIAIEARLLAGRPTCEPT